MEDCAPQGGTNLEPQAAYLPKPDKHLTAWIIATGLYHLGVA